ncbi:hypothetical protein O6H91_12G064800 [Diphasiastrum complanatum]|uniref:Uncharacterized protein n=1 Tax=Diphasiastrum complanatum TaxID=34168 RepID=A0ACC2C2U6_DIPCM|nr:hypothetical protein O6H91_12G064800 [Diphasiastrum complanatum]
MQGCLFFVFLVYKSMTKTLYSLEDDDYIFHNPLDTCIIRHVHFYVLHALTDLPGGSMKQ